MGSGSSAGSEAAVDVGTEVELAVGSVSGVGVGWLADISASWATTWADTVAGISGVGSVEVQATSRKTIVKSVGMKSQDSRERFPRGRERNMVRKDTR